MKQPNNRHKGYFYQIVSSLFFVFNQLIVKYLTKYFPPPLTLGIRGSLLFLVNYLLIYHQNIQLNAKNPTTMWLLIKASGSSGLTIMQMFPASAHIPIGIANTLYNTNPILLFIIEGFYFHKIKFNRTHAFLTVVCFVGVLLILQPEFIFGESIIQADQYPFYLLAFGSSITATFTAIFLHELKNKVNPQVPLQYNYMFQIGYGYTLFLFVSPEEPANIESFFSILEIIFLLILLIISGYISQSTRIRAVYLAKPSDVVPFTYAGIIGSLLIDIFIYDSQFSTLSIIGIFFTSIGLCAKFFVKNES